MPNYRRAFRPGGTFFFTLVTYERAPFLCSDLARTLLREAIEAVRHELPFQTDAFVLLPDHFHAIWTLPQNDGGFSKRWGKIKKHFTQAWIEQGGWQGTISHSRHDNRRRGVWQRRFWEHVIRDQDDLNRHLDYIHYNPVNHGHATCAHAWEWSSFHRLVGTRTYRPDWCCGCGGNTVTVPNFEGMDLNDIEVEFGE